MLFDLDIKGDLLPPKTVCLTYDDGPGETDGPGPGPRTSALGRFLYEQGIPATFFVIGRHAEQHRGVLRQLRDWGHLVGNHTYSHPGLVGLATSGGDVVGELERTDRLIRDLSTGPFTFLRAPYGNWREKRAPGSDVDKHFSIVAGMLNRSGRFRHYVGPINWDISSLDWEFWGRGDSGEQCAAACLERVERIGRGIILMHDSSEEAAVRAGNQTAEMTRILVGALQERGYRFVGLDAIPQVQSAMRVSAQIRLRSPTGDFLMRTCDGTISVCAASEDPSALEEPFGLEQLGDGRIALRAANGQYLSEQDGGERIIRAGPLVPGSSETLQIDDLGDGRAALRTASGRYLTLQPGEVLRASGMTRSASETFVVHLPANNAGVAGS
ncbi:MAG TPA: polysaccharide deacetylase family protein [Roseiflexaceae bacterium]|nr:polysaccharide deacetylase family protein [Roseiflexaceae bacterium]